MTTTVQPTSTSARRKPCIAIAPIVANAASSSDDAVGDAGAEQLRDDVELGVVGKPAAGDRDPVARGDAGDLLADLGHAPGGAVAERAELVEALANEVDRRLGAVAAHAVDHLPRLVGARARLREQVLLGRLERRALGPRADHRGRDLDQHVPGRGARLGNVDDLERRRPSVFARPVASARDA